MDLSSRLPSALWALRASQLAANVCCLIPGQVSCEPVNTDLVTLARDYVPCVTTNESRGEAGTQGLPGDSQDAGLLGPWVRDVLGCLGGWGFPGLSCEVTLLPGLRASQNILGPNSIPLLPNDIQCGGAQRPLLWRKAWLSAKQSAGAWGQYFRAVLRAPLSGGKNRGSIFPGRTPRQVITAGALGAPHLLRPTTCQALCQFNQILKW